MGRPSSRTVALAIGALGIAVLLLAVGAVSGAAWQSRDDADVPAMTAVDVGFAQDMAVHHDQAILLSSTVAGRPGVGQEIIGLAHRIVTAQTAENATLRGWLTWFGKPLTASDPMAWMSGAHDDDADSGHEHGSGHSVTTPAPPTSADPAPAPDPGPTMSGMASTGDISRLSGLTGRDAEVWFLQLMIRHHRGGLLMAKAAYNSDGVSETVKRTAYEMMTDQGEEISLMTMLLTARGAQALPA